MDKVDKGELQAFVAHLANCKVGLAKSQDMTSNDFVSPEELIKRYIDSIGYDTNADGGIPIVEMVAGLLSVERDFRLLCTSLLTIGMDGNVNAMESYKRGVADGDAKLNDAYERGLGHGKKHVCNREANDAYERGLGHGKQFTAEAKKAMYQSGYDDGVSDGSAMAVKTKNSIYDTAYADGKNDRGDPLYRQVVDENTELKTQLEQLQGDFKIVFGEHELNIDKSSPVDLIILNDLPTSECEDDREFSIGDTVLDGVKQIEGVLTRVCEYFDGSFQGYVEVVGQIEGTWVEIDRLSLVSKKV